MIFKCSRARGNPTAISPNTRSINSQNQNRVPNKIALSDKWGRKHSKWSLNKYMAGTDLARSCLHIAALPLQHSTAAAHLAWQSCTFPEAMKNTRKKTRQLYPRREELRSRWLSGRKAEPELLFATWAQPAQHTERGWGPARKWTNGRKIKVLVTTSEVREDKISLLLQLSSWHFPLCILFDFACFFFSLFFFFVIYRVCD